MMLDPCRTNLVGRHEPNIKRAIVLIIRFVRIVVRHMAKLDFIFLDKYK
jgi:hypothetical protein